MDGATADAPKIASVGLSYHGADDLCAPDNIRLTMTEDLLRNISAARMAIMAMGVETAEVIIPLRQAILLYEGGEPFVADGESEAGEENMFKASSVWLGVTDRDIRIEVWEEHSSDTLDGILSLQEAGILDDLTRTDGVVRAEMTARLAA